VGWSDLLCPREARLKIRVIGSIRSDGLTDRYSESKKAAKKEAKRHAAEAMRHEVKTAE
jgi:arsenical resistance protein ArsH